MTALKEALVFPPDLAITNSTVHKKPDSEAFHKQVGWMLRQKQEDGTTQNIGYCSCSLNEAEKIFNTKQMECQAITCSELMLHPRLKRKRFTIQTDHDSLIHILNATDSTGRLSRCRLRLLKYNFVAARIAGIKR